MDIVCAEIIFSYADFKSTICRRLTPCALNIKQTGTTICRRLATCAHNIKQTGTTICRRLATCAHNIKQTGTTICRRLATCAHNIKQILSYLPTRTRCCCLRACPSRPGPVRCCCPARRRGPSCRFGPDSGWCQGPAASSWPSWCRRVVPLQQHGGIVWMPGDSTPGRIYVPDELCQSISMQPLCHFLRYALIGNNFKIRWWSCEGQINRPVIPTSRPGYALHRFFGLGRNTPQQCKKSFNSTTSATMVPNNTC